MKNQIGNRIEHNLDKDKFGFRRNRGAREAILILRGIADKMMKKRGHYTLLL